MYVNDFLNYVNRWPTGRFLRKLFNGRQVYMKCVPINYEGMKLYAYVGRDVAMRELERKQIVNRVVNSKKPVNKEELQKEALQKPPCQAGWNKNVLFGFS